MDFYFLLQSYVFDYEREQQVFITAVKQLQVIIFYDCFLWCSTLEALKTQLLPCPGNFFLVINIFIFKFVLICTLKYSFFFFLDFRYFYI